MAVADELKALEERKEDARWEELRALSSDLRELKALFGASTQSLHEVVKNLSAVGQAGIKLGRLVVFGFLLVIAALVSKAVYVELNFPFGTLRNRHEEATREKVKEVPPTLTAIPE